MAWIEELQNEPEFIYNYFDTIFGRIYLDENPPKPLSEDLKLKMSQKMEKSRHGTEE